MFRGEDLTGKIYDRLTVIEYAGNPKPKIYFWKCLCICGNETLVRGGSLKSGQVRSCGCLRIDDIAGKVYGRLTVVKYAYTKEHGEVFWYCLCSCGNEKIIAGRSIKRGLTVSCGCYKREQTSKASTGDGLSSARKVYNSNYRGAIKRGYKFSITFEQFLEITKLNCTYCNRPPSKKYTSAKCTNSFTYNGIDRFDNTMGYILENCVPSCFVCNRAKGDMTYLEFKQWLKEAYCHTHQECL